MTNKLDKIIELMDAHFFKNLKEICEIPAHRSAIEAIINEPVWNKNLADMTDREVLVLTENNEIYEAYKTSKGGFKAADPSGGGLVYINGKITAWQPLPPVE